MPFVYTEFLCLMGIIMSDPFIKYFVNISKRWLFMSSRQTNNLQKSFVKYAKNVLPRLFVNVLFVLIDD